MVFFLRQSEETQRKESQSINLDYTDDDEVMSSPANPTIPPTPKMSITNRKPATLIAPKSMKIGQTTGKQSHTDKAIQELRELSEKLDTPADDNNNNEFNYFGKFIACHLQTFSEHLALESMAFIQSYLIQQRLKNNTKNSQQIVYREESILYSAANSYEYSDYITI
ncbi:unnamed protein product [Psylliodes chrysocephalus]|uniref:Uncharacterized protein n=1 Tax=Psylliodes chrysocephalus TaxID=3402493 RepID=A0A9P0CIH7_9CUCU|nr:unnamed protein product [Psylliodes chrysocephala]